MASSVQRGLRPSTRVAIVLLMLSPLALAVPGLFDPEWDFDFEAERPMATALPLAPRPAGELRTIDSLRPIAGFAINAHYISDLNLYLQSVDEVAALGANSVVVLTPMYQETVESSQIRFVPSKCATDEQLIAILQHARFRGLHTTLLPIVLIERPGEKDWRGVIQPASWDAWWSSYDDFIDRFVSIAVQADVDLLAIGSELNSTENQLDRWERIVERVRDRFIRRGNSGGREQENSGGRGRANSGGRGQITYSANWDRYDKIELWPLVDVMCVSSYFELERDDPEASEAELVRAWRSERRALIKAARKWDRPLLLSEVGYPSLPWASAHPWNYVAPKGTEADHESQAKCWRAFFQAWGDAFVDEDGPSAGFFGYAWSPYYHGDAWDTGYGINGKPAYEVVRRGIARIRQEARAVD